jgi:hypothetical protein
MTLQLRRRLEDVEQWGWVIYRTVYTSESDQRWGEVVKRLDGLILSNYDEWNARGDLVFAAAARERYQNIILDDKEKFNNAPWELLEQHYKDWVPTASPRYTLEYEKNATWKAFLIIDEAAISKIINAPPTQQEQHLLLEESPESCSITVVGLAEEPDNYEFDYETGEEHYLDEEDPDFEIISSRTWPGHFQVSIYMLYTLWEHLSAANIYAEEYVLPNIQIQSV